MDGRKLAFASDYMEGAHERIMERLLATNRESTPGYGTDSYCESAKEKIRMAAGSPNASVYFLVGGTQTNAAVIGAMLPSYQGVLASASGHVSLHEAGAIELTGHKVLTLPHLNGKISAEAVENYVTEFYRDENHEHMVMPGMVYLSQPTEYGTLYSKQELSAIHEVCRKYGLSLYIDGARLAYAFACPENDITLQDLAALCDVFYIGGTKCGALFGEAVVIPNPERLPHFFTMIKQRGALLAKGRLLGIQFDTLFTDNLYFKIGESAIAAADILRKGLKEKGYTLCYGSPTNQIFLVMENEKLSELKEHVEYSFWEPYDETHTIIRLVTSWATEIEDAEVVLSWI